MTQERDLLELYYTETEVAHFLKKSIFSLRADACRRKGAPRTKIGRRILYKKSSFEKWLTEKETDFTNLRK